MAVDAARGVPAARRANSQVPGARFLKGEHVTWSSNARGVVTRKIGAVDLVVASGRTPSSSKYRKWPTSRLHESYIIDIAGELCWPVASQLRSAR